MLHSYKYMCCAVALAAGLPLAAFAQGAPKGEAPKAETPKAGAPKGEAPKAEAAPPAAAATGAPAEEPVGPNTEAIAEEQLKKRESEAATQAHNLRLRTLERRVNELKERIFKSKARLTLLAETVISGALTGAKAEIFHVNEMGSSFVLTRMIYTLDGTPIHQKTDETGALGELERIKVLDAPVVPGSHTLTVRVTYTGSGSGLFSYIEGYQFKLGSTFNFEAMEGKVTTVEVVAYEKGGLTTDLRERPSLRVNIKSRDDVAGRKAGKERAAAAEGSTSGDATN